MNLPGTTRVAVLVGRARDAGAVGAAGFADWLIIDEQWFGPCADMDASTYRRWRRRAEEMYAGPPDAVVTNNSRVTPWKVLERPAPRRTRPAPRRTPPAPVPAPPSTAVTVVRRSLYVLAVLLIAAVAGVSKVATVDPPGQAPPTRRDHSVSCTVTICADHRLPSQPLR